MLVEHTFITTVDSGPAMLAVADTLAHCGFSMTEQADGVLAARRGCAHASRARTVSQLPQTIRVEFDRGRVMLAINAEEHRKPGPLLAQLLVTLATAIENSTAGGMPPCDAARDFVEVETRVAAARTREVWIKTLVVVLSGAGLFALIVVLANLK